MQTVRVLRPFANGHHDRIVHPGDLIEVTKDRAEALKANSLVEDAAAEKAGPPPANKMAPVASNKATPARRGRPPKGAR